MTTTADPRRYFQSPVDYEAWRKGYTPPSEHVLIHKLMTGEMRVLMSTELSPDYQWTLCVNPNIDRATLAFALKQEAELLESIVAKRKPDAEPAALKDEPEAGTAA